MQEIIIENLEERRITESCGTPAYGTFRRVTENSERRKQGKNNFRKVKFELNIVFYGFLPSFIEV